MITDLQLQQMQDRLARNKHTDRSEGDQELRRTMKGNVEKEIVLHRKIQKVCEERGWIALHGSTAHRAMRTVGEWDFVIIADHSRVFLVECKTATGKLTPEQRALHSQAYSLGHAPMVVRSIEEFLENTKRILL
jgi:hypothetical protein